MIRHYNCDKPIPARNLDSPIRRAIQWQGRQNQDLVSTYGYSS
jgi:hypothetical protein